MSLQSDLLAALSDFRDELSELISEHATEQDPDTNHGQAAEPRGWKVGDVLSDPALIPEIPAGTALKDKDGDTWYKHDNGFFNFDEEHSSYETGFNLADFLPATIVSVRQAPTLATEDPQVGDRVIANHPEWTLYLTKAPEVESIGADVAPIAPKSTVEDDEPETPTAADEPEWTVPTDSYGYVDYEFRTQEDDRRVLVQHGFDGDGQVYVYTSDESDAVNVWMTREEARRFVQAIQAITES